MAFTWRELTYNDAHRRAEFLDAISGASSRYRTTYDVTITPTQTIDFATSAGHSAIIYDPNSANAGCALFGGLDITYFDNYFATTVLNAVQGDPTSFVIFLMHDVVFYEFETTFCCILGYHGTLNNLQTYSPTDYDTTGDFGPRM